MLFSAASRDASALGSAGRLRGEALSLLAGIVLLTGSARASAAEVAHFRVITNASNPTASLTKDELAKMYLKKTTTWGNGHRVLLVDLPESSSVRKHFSELILDKPIEAVKAYWQQRVFSGRDVPPLEKRNEAEVVDYVLSHSDALGYVSAEQRVEGVKVLTIEIQVGADAKREER